MKDYHQPRLLPQVLQAIAELHDAQGSNTHSIVEYVQNNSLKTLDNQRNVTMEVRKALRHAVNTGIVSQRSGKFRLGPNETKGKKKKAIDPLKDCRTCRRRRRRSRRSRRRRRGSVAPRDDTTTVASVSDSEPSVSDDGSSSSEPQDRGRRRRRRRSRRRRRRHSDTSDGANSDNDQQKPSPDGTKSSACSNNFCHQDENHRLGGCDNPACICHLKGADQNQDNLDKNSPNNFDYLN